MFIFVEFVDIVEESNNFDVKNEAGMSKRINVKKNSRLKNPDKVPKALMVVHYEVSH